MAAASQPIPPKTFNDIPNALIEMILDLSAQPTDGELCKLFGNSFSWFSYVSSHPYALSLSPNRIKQIKDRERKSRAAYDLFRSVLQIHKANDAVLRRAIPDLPPLTLETTLIYFGTIARHNFAAFFTAVLKNLKKIEDLDEDIVVNGDPINWLEANRERLSQIEMFECQNRNMTHIPPEMRYLSNVSIICFMANPLIGCCREVFESQALREIRYNDASVSGHSIQFPGLGRRVSLICLDINIEDLDGVPLPQQFPLPAPYGAQVHQHFAFPPVHQDD